MNRRVAIVAQYPSAKGLVTAAAAAAGAERVDLLVDPSVPRLLIEEANEAGIQCVPHEGLNSDGAPGLLEARGCGLVVMYGVRDIVNARALLRLPRVINFHPSLLPRHRGPSPLFWTVREGDSLFGVSVTAVSAAIDKGTLLYQEALKVRADSTLASLEQQAGVLVAGLCSRLLGDFDAGRLPAGKSLDGVAAHYEGRPDDASRTLLPEHDWTTASRIVRACWPHYDVLIPELSLRGRFDPVPGADGLAVRCADGVLWVGRAKSDDATTAARVTPPAGWPSEGAMGEPSRTAVEQANIAFHSRLAAGFDQDQPYFLPENRARVGALLRALVDRAPRRTLLDVGCGTGFLIDLADTLVERILGVDLTPAMLARVRRRPHVHVALARAEAIPAFSHSFGVATAYGLLQHLYAYAPVFGEIARCLVPGGLFYADESQNAYCNRALAAIEGPAKGGALGREVSQVVDDPRRYRTEFGLEESVVTTAMFQGRFRGGVREEEVTDALRAAGFANVEFGYRWFLGEGELRRSLGGECVAALEEHLRSCLPISRPLFKYVYFVAQKEA